MFALRLATPDDFDAVLGRTQAFNVVEGITIDDDVLARGLSRLLAEPNLGGAWLVLKDGAIIGHAVAHTATTSSTAARTRTSPSSGSTRASAVAGREPRRSR